HSGLWQVAIVWGIGVMLGVYVVAGISGGHINPAITVALALWGKFRWALVGPYVLSQLVGAFVAAAALYGMYQPIIDAYEVKEGDGKRSVRTAMCYGEYHPNPGLEKTLVDEANMKTTDRWQEVSMDHLVSEGRA